MQVVQPTSLVRDAYDRGKEAAYRGRQRVSPFYNDCVIMAKRRVDITPMLDTFWLAGFDGEPYPEKAEEPNHGEVAAKSE